MLRRQPTAVSLTREDLEELIHIREAEKNPGGLASGSSRVSGSPNFGYGDVTPRTSAGGSPPSGEGTNPATTFTAAGIQREAEEARRLGAQSVAQRIGLRF